MTKPIKFPRILQLPWSEAVDEQTVQGSQTGISAFGGSIQEGYVVRRAAAIPWARHPRWIAKYVRKGHVRTDSHWMHQAVIANSLHSNAGEKRP